MCFCFLWVACRIFYRKEFCMKRVVLSVVSLLFATSAFAEIITKEVLYSQDSVTFKGYMAYDNKIKGKNP
jgi:hypothetical protein